LNFVERKPRLEVGETTQLWTVGDFADQEQVLLPEDYLTWSTESETVANLSETGLLRGLSPGTTIITGARDGVEAVLATRVGEIEPTTESELVVELAEQFGLDVFPRALTITEGTVSPIYVSLAGGLPDEPDLSTEESGTRYFISNPEVAVVDPDGHVLAREPGTAQLTVIHGGAEAVIPIEVAAPASSSAILGVEGGVVESEIGGYQVVVPPSALSEPTSVSINALTQEELELELPFAGELDFIGAFSVDAGEELTQLPLQFVIPAPSRLTENDMVLVLRSGLLPDAETQKWEPGWVGEDIALLTPDGTLRTQLFPGAGSYGGSGVQNYAVLSFPIPEIYLQGLAAANEVEVADELSIDSQIERTTASPNILTAALSEVSPLTEPTLIANDDTYILDGNLVFGVGAGQGVLSNDYQLPTLDELTVTLVGTPSNGTLNFNSEDGSFQYIPDTDFPGYDSFAYSINDGTNTSQATVYLESSNDDPEAENDSYTLNEDDTLVVLAHEGLLANDTDPDEHNQLVAFVNTPPEHGFITLNADGSFTYIPERNYHGSDVFIYEVSDGRGGRDFGQVDLTINPVNDAPIARSDAYRTNYTETLEVNVDEGLLRNDRDLEDSDLTVNILEQPEYGTVTLNSDGSFTYEPSGDYLGKVQFEYEVLDSHGKKDKAIVSITNHYPSSRLNFWGDLALNGGLTAAGIGATALVGAVAGPSAGLILSYTSALASIASTALATTAVALQYYLYKKHSGVELIGIDGDTFTSTPLNVEFNEERLPVGISGTVQQPIPPEITPQTPPIIDRVELTFEHITDPNYGTPILLIEGTNILSESSVSDLGGAFEDLTVEFNDGNVVGSATPIEALSVDWPDLSRQRLAVAIPNTVSLENSIIEVVRPVDVLTPPLPEPETQEVRSLPFEPPPLPSTFSFTLGGINRNHVLVTDVDGGTIAKINLPENGWARSLKIAPDSSRVYVGFANTNQIAVIDPTSLTHIDVDPTTDSVDLITLTGFADAKVGEIAIHPNGKYAYISDFSGDRVYILDVLPSSENYHQVVGTVVISPAANSQEHIRKSRLQQMTFSSDGRLLFVTRSSILDDSSKIAVINVNPADEPEGDGNNSISGSQNSFHQIVASLDSIAGETLPARVFDITTTPEANKIALTFRRTFSSHGSYGFFSYHFSEPEDVSTFEANEFVSIDLDLGKTFTSTGDLDPLRVNDPQHVIVKSVQYENEDNDKIEEITLAFVVGAGGFPWNPPLTNNTQVFTDNHPTQPTFGSVNTTFISPRDLEAIASSNVGIIVDPLTNPELITATTPIPFGHSKSASSTVIPQSAFSSSSTPTGTPRAALIGNPAIEKARQQLEFTINLNVEPGGPPGQTNTFLMKYDSGEIARFVAEAKTDTERRELLALKPLEIVNPKVILNGLAQGLEQGIDAIADLAWEQQRFFDAAVQILSYTTPLPTTYPIFTDVPHLDLVRIPQQSTVLQPFPEQEIENLTELEELLGTDLQTLPWELTQPTTETKNRIQEVALFISTHPKGQGLLPGDDRFLAQNPPDGLPDSKLYRNLKIGNTIYKDYNPNRVLTAIGLPDLDSNKVDWIFETALHNLDGELIQELTVGGDGAFSAFPIGNYLNLTPGKYYYSMIVVDRNGRHHELSQGSFDWANLPRFSNPTAYTSVTVITPDAFFHNVNSVSDSRRLGKSIISKAGIQTNGTGALAQYNPQTGDWNVLQGNLNRRNRPLVLLTDWLQDTRAAANYNSGTAEAVADSVFSSLVALNKRTNTHLFNSPFHFIGFGAGNVVNSEIIQRLGIHFQTENLPALPDLHMTTIDPFDGVRDEPKVQVWENVTFADNYYQTATNVHPVPPGRNLPNLYPFEEPSRLNTPGLQLPQAGPRNNWLFYGGDANLPLRGHPDVSVFLGGRNNNGFINSDSRAGFTESSGTPSSKNAHGRSVIWYESTADINKSARSSNPLRYRLLRRRGDFSQPELYDERIPNANPWYTINHQPGVEIGDENAQWEGIGTGWFYSVLGNGYNLRPYGEDKLPRSSLGNFQQWSENNRVPLDWDNTREARQRGDYPVSTLFNGNFDAVSQFYSPAPVPGWTLHNNEGNLNQSALVEWGTIPSLGVERLIHGNEENGIKQTYLQQVAYTSSQPNYALLLGRGGVNEIVHNRFVVPDWGVLRFDLHTPNPNGGQLIASIKDASSNNSSWLPLGPIELTIAQNPNTLLDPNDPTSFARPNAVGYYDYNFNNQQYTDPYSHRLDFATHGFETFHLDIPEELRSKPALLKFELEGTNESVYLDNVFFKSKNVLLGNPGEARYVQNPSEDDRNNFLIERPQYTVSYNDSIKGPNWVSWQLDRSWIGVTDRPGRDIARQIKYPKKDYLPNEYPFDAFDFPWVPDNSLPGNFTKTVSSDYRYVNGPIFDKGHLSPAEDRARTAKDSYSTFITSNILPEIGNLNRGKWLRVEDKSREYIRNNDQVLHIIAGGAGYQLEKLTGYPERLIGNNIWVTREQSGKIGFGDRHRLRKTKTSPAISPDISQMKIDELQNIEGNRDKFKFGVDEINDTSKLIGIQNPKKIQVPTYFWKIIVPLAPGQGIADITANTEVMAFVFPNRDNLKTPGDFNLYDIGVTKGMGRQNALRTLEITDWSKWEQFLVSVSDIERLTGVEFFPSLPEDIAKIFKKRGEHKRKEDGGPQPDNFLNNVSASNEDTSANLIGDLTELADSAGVGFDHTGIGDDFPIGHDHSQTTITTVMRQLKVDVGLGEIHIDKFPFNAIPFPVGESADNSLQIGQHEFGISDRSPLKTNINNVASNEFSFVKIGSSQVDSVKFNSIKTNILQISPFQIDISQRDIEPTNLTEISPSQIQSNPFTVGSSGSAEISTTQIGTSQVNPTQISPTQINSGEIPLASSISLEQLLNSNFSKFHNQYPQIDTLLENTTIEITDLPPGQIAEAQLTQTDPTTGVPIAGTILIDHNANGIGWYIDPTPQDHSEYALPLTEHASLANPESDAYNRYDLLTTINHELLHLLGVIAGHEPFDQYRQEGEYSFTVDGSHLNPILHPHDLLNPSLQPGQRLLFSEHDLHILEEIYTYDPQKPIY